MDRKRPGALLAIAIIGIGLGGLGGCFGVYTILVTSLAAPFAEWQERATELQPDEAQREMQRELNHRLLEVQADYRAPILAHQGVNLLASLLLLAGAIALVRWKKSAPMLMTVAVIANAVVDLGGSVVQWLISRENSAVMADVMQHFPNGPPGMERTMQGVMGASAAMGVCWLVVIVGAKLGYYVWSAIYVRKPNVRELMNS